MFFWRRLTVIKCFASGSAIKLIGCVTQFRRQPCEMSTSSYSIRDQYLSLFDKNHCYLDETIETEEVFTQFRRQPCEMSTSTCSIRDQYLSLFDKNHCYLDETIETEEVAQASWDSELKVQDLLDLLAASLITNVVLILILCCYIQKNKALLKCKGREDSTGWTDSAIKRL